MTKNQSILDKAFKLGMKEYKVKLCKDCKFYKGVLTRSDGSMVLICSKFNLRRPISNKQQVETIGELEYGCFEEMPREDILEAKPSFYGIRINLKELFRRFFRKSLN